MKVTGTLVVLALLAAPAAARAEQMVLFDITYTHTNANDSHHGISGAMLNQPSNWTSPIDYSKGTIHFYQEVMTKPSDKPTIIDFCLMSARDYGCIETFIYTHVGLHETVRSMAGRDVDKRAVIDFTQRMRSIQMVLKTPAPTWINGGRPQSDFLPSKMRFVATLVSPGGTYIKPAPTPGFAPGDGGAGPPGDAGAGTPTMDAGGGTDPSPPPADAGATTGADAPAALDAGTTTPTPGMPAPMTPTTPDAASVPPSTTPPPRPSPTPTPTPTPAPQPAGSGGRAGCSVAARGATGGGPAPALLVGLALAAGALRARRRR